MHPSVVVAHETLTSVKPSKSLYELVTTSTVYGYTDTGALQCRLFGCVLLNGQIRSDQVWPVVSPADDEKERPDRARPGLAIQKDLNHYNRRRCVLKL